ncbi:MAG: biotin/lipoyl-binding protein, partial [Gemmatimonadetes bacterium]|nr:biotin/lipoyl-binding protein [Gemmatimonadota bacterium]
MLVAVEVVEGGSFRPAIIATGVVEPSEDVMLSPRVSGEIVERAPAFNPGDFVRKGEVLLRIDRADYENALARSLSALHQVEADLQMERGRRTVAEQDFELLDDSLTAEQKSLVLREPQLNAAKSRVESAGAAVGQARLDLARTTITAPFDAHILSRRANLG